MRGHGKGMRHHVADATKNRRGFAAVCRNWYKQAYATEAEAAKVAAHRSRESGKPIRFYPCSGHWHLTSKT